MELTVLGSAAAEGIPAIFCDCATCREAWARGGKDLRARAAYKINDRVRIDLGPDTLWQELRFALHSERLRHLIVTHSHGDHLDALNLRMRQPGFSHYPPGSRLRVYGNVGIFRKLRAEMADYYEQSGLTPVALTYYRPVEIEEEDITIHPLRANHMPEEEPMFYVLRVGAKHILIGNDTGYFPDDAWAYLEKRKFPLDLVLLDCTCGDNDNARDGHMGAKAALEAFTRLRGAGLAGEKTQCAVNHFSHNGHMLHADYEAYFAPHGIGVCWDGRVFAL